MSQAQHTDALDLAEHLDENADLDAAEGGNIAVCKLEHDAADMLRTLVNQAIETDATHLRELAAYRTTVENLKSELVQEAARTAEEKLRADQMSQQHDMQAALNREAREQLAALKAAPAAVAVPDGYALVPVNPSRAMTDVMRSFIKDGWSETESGQRPMASMYAAMLAAAPARDVQRDALTFEQRMSDWQHGDALDATRWREVLMHVGAARIADGGQHFTITRLRPLSHMDLMRGSVAQHFIKCVDASVQQRSASAALGE